MAEILVSDWCDRRPLLAGGRHSTGSKAPGRPQWRSGACICASRTLACLDAVTTGRQHARGFPTVSIVLRIVFSIVRHCYCAGGFSLAVARPCIV